MAVLGMYRKCLPPQWEKKVEKNRERELYLLLMVSLGKNGVRIVVLVISTQQDLADPETRVTFSNI